MGSKRRVTVLGAALLLAAASTTAAVSAQDESAAPDASAAPMEPLAGDLTIWDIPESDSYVDWWESYIQAFQEAHPDVTADLQTFPSEDYKTKIQSAVVAGTAPDIFYAIPGPTYYEAAAEGKVVPIDEYIPADTFTPATRAACTVDDQLVCMPLYLAPSYVYYNKAMFEQADVDPSTWADPQQPTWEEFTAAADRLKEAGIAPIGVGNGDQWPGLFYYWAIQNRYGGTDAFDAAMSGEGSFTDPSFIKAGELVQELAAKGYFQEGFNGIGGDQKYALFTQGHSAMIYMGPWMLGLIAADAPPDFDYGFFAFPSFADGDADSQTDVMAGVDALWMSSTSDAQDAAGAYLAGFTDPETQLGFSLDTQSVSAVAAVAERGEGDDRILEMARLSEAAQHAFPWWDNALAPEIANVMLGNSQALLAGDMSPQDFGQAMDEAAGS